MVRVPGPGGSTHQRKSAGYSTKAGAVAALGVVTESQSSGGYVEPSRRTVGEYLAGWLESVAGAGGIRPTTWKTYDVAVRVHIVPRLGDVPLQQLTPQQVRAAYQDLHMGGYAKGKTKTRPLSPKSVHNVHLALRKALADAVAQGLLRTNPAERAHKAPAERPEMMTWSVEELRGFLASVEDERDAPLWRLLANTGLRRGEALGLRWQDLDLARRRLSVRQQLLGGGDAVRFGPPKTRAGRRSIALDSGTAEALEAHHTAQVAERLRWGEGYQDADLVFCRPDGTRYDPDVVTHRFELAVSRAKLRRIRLHDLRHTHATLLLEAGVHPKVVQERLGHSSIVVTMDRYSHVMPTMQEEAAAKIGALIGS